MPGGVVRRHLPRARDRGARLTRWRGSLEEEEAMIFVWSKPFGDGRERRPLPGSIRADLIACTNKRAVVGV